MLGDDAPEQIQDAHKQQDAEYLAYPFWQILIVVVALCSSLGGLVWVNVGSKGAIIWRWTDQKR